MFRILFDCASLMERFSATEGSLSGETEILRTSEEHWGTHTVPVFFRENDMSGERNINIMLYY
jgi:hypothetical protein